MTIFQSPIPNPQSPINMGLVSGANRSLRLRMRADLMIQQQSYLGRHYWVVKDPVALKYYRFEEEEFALLEMLDGRAGLEEIQHRFEKRFAPQKITLQELHQLLGMLHRSALVVSDAPGQGPQLLQRHRERSRRERLAAVTNILCVRVRGFDPDRLLTWLNRRLGWLFSLPCLLTCLALALGALLLLTVQFDVFRSKLPAFHEFFGSNNWMWLAATLAITKVIHEFGHGLSCKRLGGECHEMGLMLLVLTPCLYCNVSDSWMLPNKWHRAAIGAAGMYVEIVMASVCTFLWWFTQPGMLHFLCLNVMFVCSVSTLLFNANPLLRFDGYYILADIVEIPNLRQKASTILRHKLAAWFLGLPETPDPFLPQRRQVFFAIYSIAATAYRWVVALAILWFLYHVLEPYGLKVIGQIIALVAVYGLLLQPLWHLVKFFRVPGRIDRVKKPRLIVSSAVAVVTVSAIFLIPIPHYVRCVLLVEPRDATSVYVESPGHLQEIHVRPGDWVRQGEPIVSLDNIDIRLGVLRTQGEKRRLEAKLSSLRQRAFDEENAALQMGEVEQAIAAVEEQVQKQHQDMERLQIAAPASGVIIAPPRKRALAGDAGRLPFWSGSPLDARNTRSFLAESVAVCRIGDPRRLKVVLAIDQADLEFVQVGQPVDIVLEQLPSRRFRSRLEHLSQQDMKISPQSLSTKAGGELPTRTDASGFERPISTTYQASAWLDDDDGLLFIGATGRARIYTGRQTLARKFWRYLCETFRLEA
ncbi:MAG: hemolysin D [Pirellulaceae bacterium]